MIISIWKIGKTNELNGTWDWTRTSIALRVKETYNLSTHPGNTFRMVGMVRLELTRLSTPEPKSGAATNYATFPLKSFNYIFNISKSQ